MDVGTDIVIPFICIFLFSKLFPLECQRDVSEACGSIGSLTENKQPKKNNKKTDLCKWLKWHSSFYSAEGIITVIFLLLEFCGVQFLSKKVLP